jgi:flagellar basal-body rod modification protein FlgD
MTTIGAIASTADSPARAIGMQDFLRILLTQLTYQDPLKPMDNQQFMAQVAQFTSLQQAQDTNAKLDALLSTQAALQSVGLIGKTVQVSTSNGNVVGTVTSLSLAGETPQLTLQTSTGATLTGVTLGQIVSLQ